MSTKQKELYDLIRNIDDKEIPKVIQLLQIFVLDDYATAEELRAIEEGERQIADGEFYTQKQVNEMFLGDT